MVIIGTGIDATEIERIGVDNPRTGGRFRDRVFTPGEIAYCERRRTGVESYAARFAAKEAGMKALGTGHSRGVLWRDLEVVRHGGPPQLQLHGTAARLFERLGGHSTLLTLTHSRSLALAHVLLLGDPG